MFGSEAVEEPRLSWLLEREVETRRADAQMARFLTSLDAEEVTEIDFGLTVGAWVADRTGKPVGVCRRRARLSKKLVGRFPLVLAALERAEVGWEHVEVILDAANPRIEDVFVDHQDLVLDVARHAGHFGQFKAELRGLAERLDVDGAFDARREDPGRLQLSDAMDGQLVISGSASDDEAILIRHAIDTITDEMFRQAARDNEQNPDEPIPHRSILRMRALAEICRRALARDLNDSSPPRVEAAVVVHEDGTVTTEDGAPVSKRAVQILLPDAYWKSVRVDERGNPLDVGRQYRYITTRQRVALLIRDGGCAFAGCDRPAHWCDGHHVIWWEDGGETNLDNLVLLCRHHHRMIHRDGWTMTADTDERGDPTGWFTWTTPTGRTIHSQRHFRQQHDEREPRAA